MERRLATCFTAQPRCQHSPCLYTTVVMVSADLARNKAATAPVETA